jgi:hypothetical protein
VKFAQELGSAVQTTVVPAVQAIVGAWNSIPEDVRKLLIGGFVANKAVKWTFGIDVIDTLRKSLFNAVLGIKAGVVNVQGAIVNGPGGVGGLGGAGAAAGGLSIAGVLTAAALGVAVGAAWKMLVQDPALDAQQKKVQADAMRQLKTGSMQEILTGRKAVRTGISDIEKIPGGKELYAGQYNFLKSLDKLYEKRLAEMTMDSTKHPRIHRIPDDSEHRRPRKTLADLTDRDLKRATKDGITEGNRDQPKRRDLDSTKLTISNAVRDAKRDITRVEQTGLREIRGGVNSMTSILVGALDGGFGGVIAAINGISLDVNLPAYLPQAKKDGKTVPRRKQTDSGDIPVVIPRRHGDRTGPKRGQFGGPVSALNEYLVGEDGPELFTPLSGGHISPRASATTSRPLVQLRVQAHVSPRNVDAANGTQRAYGPTASRAGAVGTLL